MEDFKDLRAWAKAHEMTLAVQRGDVWADEPIVPCCRFGWDELGRRVVGRSRG
jgi:hypothetical protein